VELQNTVTTRFVYFQYGSNGLLIKLLQKTHDSLAQISKHFCTIITSMMINKNVAEQQSDLSSEKMSGTGKDQGISHALQVVRLAGTVVTPEETGVLLSSSIHIDHIRRITMDKILSAFQCLWSRPSGIGEAEIKKWAQTEYKKDWQHAYEYYMAKGHMPSIREMK